MEKILNLTAHDIVEYYLKDCEDPEARHLVLKDQNNTSPWEVLPQSGQLATADRMVVGSGHNHRITYENVSDLPEGYDIYVVSGVYVDACQKLGRDISKLRVSYGAVYDATDPRKVIGCLGLAIPVQVMCELRFGV